jgi:hypothetical protein
LSIFWFCILNFDERYDAVPTAIRNAVCNRFTIPHYILPNSAFQENNRILKRVNLRKIVFYDLNGASINMLSIGEHAKLI